MDVRHKTAEAEFKAAPDEKGSFSALVACFKNVDLVGDRIMPGAFSKTLERFKESGDPLPIVLAHDWDNVWAHIGAASPDQIKETPQGLVVKGKLDIEDNPVAAQVHRLLERRSLKSFSIGYTVAAGGEGLAEDGANELRELDLIEAGPCLKGANPQAQLLGVKSLLKSGDIETPTLEEVYALVKTLEQRLPAEAPKADSNLELAQRIAQLELELRS